MVFLLASAFYFAFGYAMGYAIAARVRTQLAPAIEHEDLSLLSGSMRTYVEGRTHGKSDEEKWALVRKKWRRVE